MYKINNNYNNNSHNSKHVHKQINWRHHLNVNFNQVTNPLFLLIASLIRIV